MADEVKVAEPTPPEGGATPEAPVVKPDFLDPRFESVEAQAKAYKEAEKKMQQEANARADLERQNRELLARQVPVAPPVDEGKDDELFWQQPTKVIQKIIDRQLQAGVAPFIEDRYQMQKNTYANDADFKRYEPQIDQLVAAQPELKKQPGVVDKLYKVVRAMEFDPEAERKRIEAEVMQKHNIKVAGMAEGAGAVKDFAPTPKAELSSEEQAVARKLYSEESPAKAYEKYAAAKKLREGA